MKTVICGAGIGGLYVAGLLARLGHDVVLYEKAKSVDDLAYDWHDDVMPSVFSDLGIPVPEGSYPKPDWTFVAPFQSTGMKLSQRPDLIDKSIDRKLFAKILLSLSAPATVRFGCLVTKPLLDGQKVVGVSVRDEEGERDDFCDLVIDSCGVFSPIRKQLSSLGFSEVSPSSVFYVSRTFYKQNKDVPFPTDTNKAYMKHIGEQGLSWCIAHHDDTVDILIGRVNQLTREDIDRATEALKQDNPIMTDEVVKKEQICTIPVRRPLSQLTCDGYVLLGDSACMTVPMIGSGIATTLRASKILADVLSRNPSCNKENLWNYQKEVFALFGAKHCAVETLKNWLLSLPTEDVVWFFTSGILTNEDMQGASVGGGISLSLPSLWQKVKLGIKKPKLMGCTVKALIKLARAKICADRIPKKYNEKKVSKWKKKLDGLFA